jgi:hypothetical protein
MCGGVVMRLIRISLLLCVGFIAVEARAQAVSPNLNGKALTGVGARAVLEFECRHIFRGVWRLIDPIGPDILVEPPLYRRQ